MDNTDNTCLDCNAAPGIECHPWCVTVGSECKHCGATFDIEECSSDCKSKIVEWIESGDTTSF